MIDIPVFTLPQITDERWIVMCSEQLTWYLSPLKYARKWGVHYNSVLRWIAGGLLQYSVRNAGSRQWYMIPADQAPPQLKRGPKPKNN